MQKKRISSLLLYRDYSRKLKLSRKSMTILFVLGTVILILANLAGGILDNMFAAFYRTSAVRDIKVYIPGHDFERFRQRFEDDPGIFSMEKNLPVGVSRMEVPKGMPRQSTVQELRGIAAEQSKQLSGKEDLQDDEILIPAYIYYGKSNPTEGFFDTAFVRGEQFIGETVRLFYTDTEGAEQTVSLTVRGTYDNTMIRESGSYYVTRNLADQMVAAENDDSMMDAISQNTDWLVTLADYRDRETYVEKFKTYIEELESLGEIDPDAALPAVGKVGAITMDEFNYFQAISQMAAFLGFIMLGWACLLMALSQLRSMWQRRQELELLKAVGYRNKEIAGMLRMETLMYSLRILCISGGIAAGFVILYGTGILTLINPFWRLWPVINGVFLLVTAVAVVLVPLLVCEMTLFTVKRLSPIESMH